MPWHEGVPEKNILCPVQKQYVARPCHGAETARPVPGMGPSENAVKLPGHRP